MSPPVNENGPFPLDDAPHDRCPHCGATLQGGPIPERLLAGGAYGRNTHWRREVGVEKSKIYDGMLYEFCPDCLMSWPFFVGGGAGSLSAIARRLSEEHNSRVRGEWSVAQADFPRHIPAVERLLSEHGLIPVAWGYEPVDGYVRIACSRAPTDAVGNGQHERIGLDDRVSALIGREAYVDVLSPGWDTDEARPSWLQRTEPWSS